MNKYGRSLKVFVMNPELKGLKAIEVVNWTGLAHIGNREHLSILKKRQELSETGIYLLTGKDDDGDGRTKLYVGETDNFTNRIGQHARDKDWWDTFIVFTSKDQNLTKAHVRYLERVLYLLAKDSQGTLDLQNSSEPSGAKLPESDIAAMAEYSENLRFVIETMGVGIFQNTNEDHDSTEDQNIEYNDLSGTPFKNIQKKNQDLSASMIVEADKYILKKGSHITMSPTKGFKDKQGYVRLWRSITESDAVVKDDAGNRFITQKDITFTSPSAAGAIVFGCATNGRTAWLRQSDGKPLGDCQLENLPGENDNAA